MRNSRALESFLESETSPGRSCETEHSSVSIPPKTTSGNRTAPWKEGKREVSLDFPEEEGKKLLREDELFDSARCSNVTVINAVSTPAWILRAHSAARGRVLKSATQAPLLLDYTSLTLSKDACLCFFLGSSTVAEVFIFTCNSSLPESSKARIVVTIIALHTA